MSGNRDLVAASVAAAVCALIACVVPWEAVRVIAALPLALFLPGFGIIAASFGPRRLAAVQLYVMSLGMSLATLALSGLLLNVLPGGLRTITWALLLVVIVVATCLVAAARRGRPELPPARRRIQRVSGPSAAMLAVAAIVAIAAFVLAQTPLPAKNAIGYTALWMLPDAGERAVAVGVENNEQHSTSYRLEVQVGMGAAATAIRLSLHPGEETTVHVPVAAAPAAKPRRVIASLYLDRRPNAVYRRVVSWLPAKGTFP